MSHLKTRSKVALQHPLGSNLDSGLAEGLEHGYSVAAEGGSSLAGKGVCGGAGQLGLVIAALGLVGDASAVHHTGGQHIAVKLLLLAKAKHGKDVLSVQKFWVTFCASKFLEY